MSEFSFTLTDFAHFLDRKASELRRIDLTRPLKKIERLIATDIKAAFVGSRSPSNVPWLPLKNKRLTPRGMSDKKPLRVSGRLMGSVTDLNHPEHVGGVTRNSLEFGTRVPYAAIQNYGGTVHIGEHHRNKPWVFSKGGKTIFTRSIQAHEVMIPGRPYLELSPQLLDDAKGALADFVAKKMVE
jgi:phage gpG-like protein